MSVILCQFMHRSFPRKLVPQRSAMREKQSQLTDPSAVHGHVCPASRALTKSCVSNALNTPSRLKSPLQTPIVSTAVLLVATAKELQPPRTCTSYASALAAVTLLIVSVLVVAPMIG